MQAEAVEIRCQGRALSHHQLDWLRGWVSEHSHWSRKRLSRGLCEQWDWRNGRGQLKDFAARSLVETFVEVGRFAGTCYQAANWLRVGQTRGRGRQGPNPLAPTEPIREVYLHPLTRRFRQYLLATP